MGFWLWHFVAFRGFHRRQRRARGGPVESIQVFHGRGNIKRPVQRDRRCGNLTSLAAQTRLQRSVRRLNRRPREMQPSIVRSRLLTHGCCRCMTRFGSNVSEWLTAGFSKRPVAIKAGRVTFFTLVTRTQHFDSTRHRTLVALYADCLSEVMFASVNFPPRPHGPNIALCPIQSKVRPPRDSAS